MNNLPIEVTATIKRVSETGRESVVTRVERFAAGEDKLAAEAKERISKEFEEITTAFRHQFNLRDASELTLTSVEVTSR